MREFRLPLKTLEQMWDCQHEFQYGAKWGFETKIIDGIKFSRALVVGTSDHGDCIKCGINSSVTGDWLENELRDAYSRRSGLRVKR